MMRTMAAAAKGVFQAEPRMRARKPPDSAKARPRMKKRNFLGGGVTRGSRPKRMNAEAMKGGRAMRVSHDCVPVEVAVVSKMPTARKNAAVMVAQMSHQTGGAGPCWFTALKE